MPTVPTYDALQVAPKPLSGGGVNTLSLISGGGGRAVSPPPGVIGQAAVKTLAGQQTPLDGLAKIVAKMAAHADQVRLNDAMNEAIAADNHLTFDAAEGFVHERGERAIKRPDGKSLNQEYQEKLKSRFDEISDGLGNDRQRAAFAGKSAPLLAQFDTRIARHLSGEYRSYQKSVNDGTVAVARERMAASWGDIHAIDQSRAAIRAAVVEQGKLEGLSAVEVEADIVKELSVGHASVVKAAVDAGQIDYARAYLKAVGGELTAADRRQLKGLVDLGQAEAQSQEVSGKLFAKHKGNIAGALAEARATLTGKEEDAVVTRLKTLDAEREALIKRGQDDAADRAWKIYTQTGDISKVPISVRASMDGRAWHSLEETAKREAGGEIKTDPSVRYALALAAAEDPNFANEDLRTYFDRLSKEDRTHFMDIQAQLRKPADAAEVVTVTQQIKSTVDALGLKDKHAGLFHRQAETALFAAQQEKGKKLDQEERQKVLDRLMLQGKTPGTFWDSSARAFEAQAEGKDFIPEFSDADVRKATRALKNAGIDNPTPQQIDGVLRSVYGIKQ